MSTYYFLVCKDCKEYVAGASRTAGGYCPLADSQQLLTPFIIKHANCEVDILDEHTIYEDSHDGYVEWETKNLEKCLTDNNAPTRREN